MSLATPALERSIMLAFSLSQESSCRGAMRMAASFLGLTVKVHGSYVKKATTEGPMELEFT